MFNNSENKVLVSAFTTKSNNGILKQLTNEVVIQNGSKSETAFALWDTGATGTCISKKMVTLLSLIPTGMKNIQTPSGSSQVHTYLVNIVLPNNVIIKNVEVCDSEIGDQGFDILIGMDIITQGDFAVSNLNNKTVFSFRVPSLKSTDYAGEIRKQNLIGTHGPGKRKKHRK